MATSGTPLTPELLRTFLAVVRADGSPSEAAVTLNIQDASVSKRLKPLHEGAPPHIPRPWLQKKGKRFKLTDEGQRLLASVTDQLERWDHFVAFTEAGKLPRLSVACGQDALAGVVRDAARRFRRTREDAAFRLSVARGRARIEGVASGLYDLALVTHDTEAISRLARRPLYQETLYEDPLVLVCGAESPWADAFKALPASGAQANDLARFPLVLPEPDSALRQQLDQRLRQAGVLDAVEVALELGGWRNIEVFVADGFGVGVLPQSVAARREKTLLTHALHPSVAPSNLVTVIARQKADSDQPDVSEQGESFLQALRDGARKVSAQE
jgi:DNA-binding transcriptional LysR family regulator